VRYLHLGTIWIQGGMRMGKPQVVAIDYVQRMLASLLWLPSGTGQGRPCNWGWGPAPSRASPPCS
jgi:spermidine synthase